jgi:alkylated DNA repair dioxygenase AlkB
MAAFAYSSPSGILFIYPRCPKDGERMKVTETAEYPEGLLLREDFLTAKEEEGLVREIRALSFETFHYRGYEAKRRVIAWGWSYDFTSEELSEAAPIPEFLLPVRHRAAEVAGIPEDELVEALATEYPPGAQIAWHRDLPMFEKVIGISLLGSCTFRLKSYRKDARPLSIHLPPRSLYVMSGASRWKYRHSIPPVKELRYSITFRTLRG